MARSITIRQIDRSRPGRTFFRVEDQAGGRSEVEVPADTLAELRAWVRQQFDERDDFLLALALAAYFARDPDLSNPSLILNRTLTVDLTGRLNYPDSVLRVS